MFLIDDLVGPDVGVVDVGHHRFDHLLKGRGRGSLCGRV